MTQPPRPRRTTEEPPSDGGTIVDGDPFESRTSLDDSPLAIEGDLLVERVGDRLWQWDLATMRRTDVFSLPARSFTVLRDRSIVAWGQDAPGAAECTLYRLAGTAFTKYTTLVCVGGGEMLRRAGTADAVYVVYRDRVVQFRFAGDKLDDGASLPLPSPSPSAFAQIASLDDGRLVVPRNDGVAIIAPDAPPVLRATKRPPRHLAQAATGYWYSYATDDPRRVNALVHAGERDTEIDLAPARIVDMAAHGDSLALLLATGPEQWHVALVRDGREQWRAPVPTHSTREMVEGAVGVSATRVVLHSAKTLRAWSVTSGETVDVVAP